MDKKPGFLKNYLILSQEDTGYGTGKTPSGYIKIEVREGKGKLVCSVENLREDKSLTYSLCLVAVSGEELFTADAGIIPLKRGAGELKWEFDPLNAGKSGKSIDKYNVFAVLTGLKENETGKIACPLVAPKGIRADWKMKLVQKLSAANKQREVKPPSVVNLTAARYPEAESIYKPVETKPEFNIAEKAMEKMSQPIVSESYLNKPVLSDEEPEIQASREETETGDAYGRSKAFMGQSADELINTQQQNPLCNMAKSGICKPVPGTPGVYPCSGCTGRIEQNYKPEPTSGKQSFSQPYQQPIQPETAGEPLKTPAEGRKAAANDLSRLKYVMDRSFERYDPFRSKRKDYMWWKVNSPVNLNNVLYQSNIKTPLLFNPALMMAHFKYRHLIAGVYTDKENNVEYIVCGVPGVYSIDEKPFGELCRWAQLEGTRPRYGAFGYWLVYIDPETGKFLNVR